MIELIVRGKSKFKRTLIDFIIEFLLLNCDPFCSQCLYSTFPKSVFTRPGLCLIVSTPLQLKTVVIRMLDIGVQHFVVAKVKSLLETYN